MGGGYVYPGTKVELGGGRGWLDGPAAASIFRIDAAIGHLLQITEAGRSFFTQEQHYLKYLRDGYPIALNPNTPSEHQKGQAVDSDEAQNFVAFMEEHGWFRTVYRWVNGKWTLVERWHFEYFIARDKHRNDPISGGGTASNEGNEYVKIYESTDVDGNGHAGVAVLNEAAPIATGERSDGRENPVLLQYRWSGASDQAKIYEKLYSQKRIPVTRSDLELAILIVDRQQGHI